VSSGYTAQLVSLLHSVRTETAADELRRAAAALRFHLERRYRPDQPRAPRGTPEGGQWVEDVTALVRRAVQKGNVADLSTDLEELGGGRPRLKLSPKGAKQFIFPNGLIVRFDLLPGQYLPGQLPHINVELPGKWNEHINLR
jgi:hypothetical protein